MTNFDKITQRPEILAEYMHCIRETVEGFDTCIGNCEKCITNWLNQEEKDTNGIRT